MCDKKDKENAYYNFIEMIEKSWTFEKLTKEEQNRLVQVFDDVRTKEALKGSYNQRWETLQAVYMAFLTGVGYDGFNWRD